MQWLLLAFLVPAIVVPVVLLWGFAGCQLVFPLDEPPVVPEVPKADQLVATPISTTQIELTWVNPPGLQVEIHRAVDGGAFELLGTVLGPPFVDPPNFGGATPLQRGVTYHYQVFATDGENLAEGSNIALARPLAFQFDLSLPGGGNQNRAGDTIIQKIPSNLLSNSGQVVKLHVRGTLTDTLVIDGIYLSRVAPPGDPANPTPDPYDADSDLVLVASGVVVLANTTQVVEVSNPYTIVDPVQDLLIAFDMNATEGKVHHAVLTGAVSYTLDANLQGSEPNRFPNPANPALTYDETLNRLYIIERIEVL